MLVMEYFLDLLTTDQKKKYSGKDFYLEINEAYQNIKIVREPTPQLQALKRKISQKKHSITKLFIFVDMIYKKLT